MKPSTSERIPEPQVLQEYAEKCRSASLERSNNLSSFWKHKQSDALCNLGCDGVAWRLARISGAEEELAERYAVAWVFAVSEAPAEVARN
jgi:hypothetical protein